MERGWQGFPQPEGNASRAGCGASTQSQPWLHIAAGSGSTYLAEVATLGSFYQKVICKERWVGVRKPSCNAIYLTGEPRAGHQRLSSQLDSARC